MEKHVEKSSRNFLRRCKKRGRSGANKRTNERTDESFRAGAKLGKFMRAESENSADITDDGCGRRRGGGGRGETRVRKLYFDSFYEVTDIR